MSAAGAKKVLVLVFFFFFFGYGSACVRACAEFLIHFRREEAIHIRCAKAALLALPLEKEKK